MKHTRAAVLLAATGLLALGGCSSGSDSPAAPSASNATTAAAAQGSGLAAADAKYPNVVKVVPSSEGDGSWTFKVTLSSPYDSPERYADGWRVKDGDRVFGEKTLGHDHASEQPVTRTQTGVKIPQGVTSVTVQGRGLKNGYGGGVAEVKLPR